MRVSIRYQLLVPLLALMIGLVGVSIWSAWSAGQRARRQIEVQIDDIANTVNAVPYPLTSRTLHLMKGMSGAEFLLCDMERRPIRDDEDKLVGTLASVPGTLPVPAETLSDRFEREVQVGKELYLCGGVRLRHRPGAVLYIFYPESLMREAVWQSLWPAVTLGIVGSLLAVLLSVLLTQLLSMRIQSLERRTRLIAEGDFSPMPVPSLNDELRDLTRSVNDMAQRLAQFQDTSRQTERLRLLGQVRGGLAHQLRNGVAGARLAVQLHAQDCPLHETDESVRVALRQLSLVEMHLKKFLDLGKTVDLQRAPCRLDMLVRESAALLGPQCRHAHIDLRVPPDDAPSIEVFADAAQLGHIFLNVLTNAVEAAGPGGWVSVQWESSPTGRAIVEVRDSGAGPSLEVASRLFEPFVTGKREGVGLGLAVARQVAEAHGGSIAWARKDGCTCFRIELPNTGAAS